MTIALGPWDVRVGDWGGGEWCSREVGSCKGGDKDRIFEIRRNRILRNILKVNSAICRRTSWWLMTWRIFDLKTVNYPFDVLENHSSRLEKGVIKRLWEKVRGRFIFDKRKTCLIKSYMLRNVDFIWYEMKTSIAFM